MSIDPLGRHGHELHAQKLLLALVFRVLASPSFDVEIGNDGSRCVGWAELTSLFSVRRERESPGQLTAIWEVGRYLRSINDDRFLSDHNLIR